jgi:methylmalonyl-CoA mutase N-terminal domain/subunit
VRIALRTQQIVANESGFAGTIDPLGGSYYVEHLTDTIEEKALEYIDKIARMGGMVTSIENSYPQGEIQEAAYRYQNDIEKEERIIVGVNSYMEEERPQKNLLTVDPVLREQQIKKLEKVKEKRDSSKVALCLEDLRVGAKDKNVNLMPLILNAVSEYASIGEICGILRAEFGEFRESVTI